LQFTCLRKIPIEWWPRKVRNETISETTSGDKVKLGWTCNDWMAAVEWELVENRKMWDDLRSHEEGK